MSEVSLQWGTVRRFDAVLDLLHLLRELLLSLRVQRCVRHLRVEATVSGAG